jgi:predicted nucleic acid-binding protein
VRDAYIDTSFLIGLKFEEPGASIRKIVSQFRLYSSELLVAETLAFARRESLEDDLVRAAIIGISWIIPDRSLAPEIESILRNGHLRGADAWHIACALFLSANPADLRFLTLDSRQRDIARKVGFVIPDFVTRN